MAGSMVADVHTEDTAGEMGGRATGSGSMGSGGGIHSGGLQGDKKRGSVQKISGVWRRTPAGCRKPRDQAKGLRGSVGCQGSQE